MSAELLKRLLQNKDDLDDLYKWLQYDEEETVAYQKFKCLPGEFVSYFLNFIHNEIADFNTTNYLQTPKSIKDVPTCDVKKETVRKSLSFCNHLNVSANQPKESSTPSTTKQTTGNLEMTPKLNKSLCNLEQTPTNSTTFMSPISPLYDNNYSFTTSRVGSSKSERNLCFGDFLVTASSNKKKCHNASSEKRSKRINPTNVGQRKCSMNLNKSENSFSFKNDESELSSCDHRALMMEERNKLIVQSDEKDLSKVKIKTQLFEKEEFAPRESNVTFKNELNVAVAIYTFVLSNNMLVNVASEVHYLISLLLKRNFINKNDIEILNDSDDFENFKPQFIFQSFHNIFYFISQTLWDIRTILNSLDKNIMKHLSENPHIKTFCRNVDDFNFGDFQSTDGNLSRKFKEENNSNCCLNVTFDTETDNRENFPSDAAFHAFRKQRDLFYDILRIWEQNRFMQNWKFSLALSGKIKALLNLYNDSANFRHLAKLFKAQLLNSKTENETIPDNELAFLSKFSNIDTDKLNRLRTRFFTKQDRSISANPTPEFHGHQEFFKEFILNATYYEFIAHLKDAFICEIVELNNNYASIADQEDFESDNAGKEHYESSIRNLRTLAKFLGFIDSLPYKTIVNCNDKVFESAIKVRSWTQSSINLKSILEDAIRNGTLIVTIPWIVIYLAMLDAATLRLPHFSKFYRSIFEIYFNKNWTENDVCVKNKALIAMSIGWLLEFPQFPTELYFDWLSKRKRILPPTTVKISIDSLNVVDQSTLYDCCPYLEEIRKLLIMSNVSNNKGPTVKHITPLTTKDTSSMLEENKLKSKLEDAFLSSQPISTRKTIEFVSERVASASIKHICNKIVPEYKKIAVVEFKTAVKDFNKDDVDFNDATKTLIADKATKCLDELLRICGDEVEKIKNEKIKSSIYNLLAIDELEETKKLCTSIAKKICMDRIDQWILSHVNKDLFLKMFESSLNKIDKDEKPSLFLLPSAGRNTSHNSDCLSPKNCVEILRSTIWDVLKKTDTEWNVIESILKSVDISINERCDFNDKTLSVINILLLELLLLYITHNTRLVPSSSSVVMLAFASFWKRNSSDSTLFIRILSARNVFLLAQSTDIQKTWSLFALLIKVLLKESLLDHRQFEEQCLGIYHFNWDKGTLRNLSKCFQEVVINDESNSGKFPQLLSFLSSYCWDLNDSDDF